MRSKARNNHLKSLRGLSGALILLCGPQTTLAQCRAEAKLVVSPSHVRTSVAALHATAKSQRQIYLYDTDGLELLVHGVILRLRTGARGDMTVKLRWDNNDPDRPHESGRSTKCEVDIVGNAALTSHSLVTRWTHESAPRTGEALHAALSIAQQQLLATTGVAIDWHRVKRIAEIRATQWQVRGSVSLNEVSIELWEWPSGKVLELSAKADNPENGQSKLGLLQRMALARGLVIEEDQKPKATIVLNAISTSTH
jgi:hypothetical protein